MLMVSAMMAGTLAAPVPTPKPRVSLKNERILLYAAAVVDIASTVRILSKPGGKELNPLLGKKPSAKKLIAVKAGALVLIEGINALLRKYPEFDEQRKWNFRIAGLITATAAGLNLQYVW